MNEEQPISPPSFNPAKFFAFQFLCIWGWLITFGALAFVIVSDDNILMVLQGWGMDDPFQIEM